MNETLEDSVDGIKVGGHLVNAVRFADDQAMVASTEAGLQRIMDQLVSVSQDYGMRINVKKTKVMKISKEGTGKVNITVDTTRIEQVKELCYLGSLITEDNYRCHHEVRRRICMGKDAFNKSKELLRGKTSFDLKKRLVHSCEWSVALYGSETWTLLKDDIQRFEAFEMMVWRRMLVS